MLITLIAAGVIQTSGVEVTPGTGLITAPASRTAVIKRTAGGAAATGLPLNAAPWPLPFDPSDHLPYAMDFSTLLGTAKIASIDRLTVWELGASHGLQIDSDPDFPVLIDSAAGQKIEFWLKIDDSFAVDAVFSGAGAKMGISALITTDDSPHERFEGTAVLTGQQQ